jgi:3-hydroxymyristoyl/3-hydroxydecanoyl-(acyl carrier protein) dehydratase
MPFFSGHFPGLPIMPAVAQIGMIQSLLQQQAGWNAVITGGAGLKFSGRIRPDENLTIRLQHTPSGEISFTVENDANVVSKGILQLAGSTLD